MPDDTYLQKVFTNIQKKEDVREGRIPLQRSQTMAEFGAQCKSRLVPDVSFPRDFAEVLLIDRNKVPEPAWRKPTEDQLFLPPSAVAASPHIGASHSPVIPAFDTRRIPNTDFLREHFFREGKVTEEQALFILRESTAALSKEQNLLELDGAVTVCGDVHGQYVRKY